jgi:adenylate cyclase
VRKSISLKIFSIALVVLSLMGVVSGISWFQLDRVKDEAIELARYYIPIEQKVQRVARHASAEIIHFERYLNLREAKRPETELREELDQMSSRAAAVDEVINQALALVGQGKQDDDLDIHSKEFYRLEAELPQIERAHQKLHDTMQGYLRELKNGGGSPDRLAALEAQIARDRRAVSKEVDDVTDLIETVTRASADEALYLERIASRTILAVTLTALVLGLLLAALITISLVRPVKELVAGTKAVEGGDLSVNVKVNTSDEIASLADSFNHMVGGLKQKERIESTFGKYVDPRIVKTLIEAEHGGTGERRVATLFFSDIENFTSICEQMPADGVVRFLNRYFSVMAGPIGATDGIIDKYIGDSIMAFWAPPFVSEREHAVLAVRAAVAQLALIETINLELPGLLGVARDAAPHINVRIGITTGEVTVGSVGSEQSKSYTVIGDAVNLASRLEGANKLYGTRLLISESTRSLLEQQFVTRELDTIRVKGKDVAVRVFEVLGATGQVETARERSARSFEAALNLYRAGELDAAQEAFAACQSVTPDDPALGLFLGRIAALKANGVPSGWDGIWRMG